MARVFVSPEAIEVQLVRSDTALRNLDDKAEELRDALMERIDKASRGKLNDSFLEVIIAPDERTRDRTLFIVPDGQGSFSKFFLQKAERENWVEDAIAEVFARGG